MYRAPEMVDTWNNFYVGPPVDIWALGCILYMLCYMKHPFEDSAKLRIINANYSLPADSKFSCFHDIISRCFYLIFKNISFNFSNYVKLNLIPDKSQFLICVQNIFYSKYSFDSLKFN